VASNIYNREHFHL